MPPTRALFLFKNTSQVKKNVESFWQQRKTSFFILQLKRWGQNVRQQFCLEKSFRGFSKWPNTFFGGSLQGSYWYRVYKGFRLNNARWSFLSHFWPLLKRVVFLEAAGAVAKIDSSLKPIHHNQIMLVQIPEMHKCTTNIVNKHWLHYKQTGSKLKLFWQV